MPHSFAACTVVLSLKMYGCFCVLKFFWSNLLFATPFCWQTFSGCAVNITNSNLPLNWINTWDSENPNYMYSFVTHFVLPIECYSVEYFMCVPKLNRTFFQQVGVFDQHILVYGFSQSNKVSQGILYNFLSIHIHVGWWIWTSKLSYFCPR